MRSVLPVRAGIVGVRRSLVLAVSEVLAASGVLGATGVLAASGVLAAAGALGACGGSTSGSPAEGGAPATANKIYVTVYGNDEIVGIDGTSRAVVDHIALGPPVAPAKAKGPAILLKTPDGKKLYAANWQDNTLSAVDVATQAVTTIPLGSRPWVEAMSPKGDVVYAGLNANTIAVISTASDTVVRMIDTKNLLAESIIVSPDGNTLYVALADQSSITGLLAPGKIAALSSTDGTVVHPDLTVGEAPAWITISPDGSKVFSLNFLSNSISVIDTAAWTVSTTVTNASINEPIIGGVAPNGTLAVTDFGNPPNVTLLDTTTHQVTHTLKTSGRPVGIDFSPDGTRGYATVFGADSLSIAPDPLALQSGNLSSRIGSDPGQVLVFDVATGAAIGDPIDVGGAGPTSVVVE